MNSFYTCMNLQSVEIPDGVTSIGGHAFSGCSGIKSITLPANMTEIGSGAFSGCTSLTSIAIPEGITELNGTFSGCMSLTSVDFPSTVLTLVGTFGGCKSLTSIEIPDGVVLISDGAFRNCSNLTDISLPDSVQIIGDSSGGVFVDCSNLTSIVIPFGVHTIGNNTFTRCTELHAATIPVTVEVIDVSAFAGCSALTDIYYTGTEAQWNEVVIEKNNELLDNATVHYLGTEQKGNPVIVENKVYLTEGEHPSWSDRVILPPAVQEVYDWLEESTDGDGENDVLISAAAEDDYPIVYYYNLNYMVEGQSRSELFVKLAREHDALMQAIAVAYEAFRHDHPDVPLFRTDVFSRAHEYTVLSDNLGKVYISLGIYLQSFTEEGYYTLLNDQENAIEEILLDIPEDLSRYEQVRCFNSYLSMNNSYGSNSGDPASHYAITALEGNCGANGPVCEAYAKAFKMLCDARGIPCELIVGKTENAPFGIGHAWNAVQMEDGKWYAVDTTWNDPSTTETASPVSGIETENFLLVGSETVVEGSRFVDSHIAWEYSSTITFNNYPILSETAYIPAEPSEHVVIIDKAVAPTCTENGFTEGSHCYLCGEVFVAQEILPALGGEHSFQHYISDGNATCLEDGTRTATCDRCGTTNTIGDKGSALGHALGGWDTVMEATCTADGYERRDCSRCDHYETRTIAAIGHSYREPRV